MKKVEFIGKYMDKHMKNHGLPYGMAYLNLEAKTEQAAEKAWKKNQNKQKQKKMTHKDKINYMRIAAGICGFGFSNEQMDLLVTTYEYVIENKGQSNVGGLCEIQSMVEKRAEVKRKTDLLDKVSKKVK